MNRTLCVGPQLVPRTLDINKYNNLQRSRHVKLAGLWSKRLLSHKCLTSHLASATLHKIGMIHCIRRTLSASIPTHRYRTFSLLDCGRFEHRRCNLCCYANSCCYTQTNTSKAVCQYHLQELTFRYVTPDNAHYYINQAVPLLKHAAALSARKALKKNVKSSSSPLPKKTNTQHVLVRKSVQSAPETIWRFFTASVVYNANKYFLDQCW